MALGIGMVGLQTLTQLNDANDNPAADIYGFL